MDRGERGPRLRRGDKPPAVRVLAGLSPHFTLMEGCVIRPPFSRNMLLNLMCIYSAGGSRTDLVEKLELYPDFDL